MLATLGSIGIGLVWGWLLALVGDRGRQPWYSILLLGLATLLAMLELLLFTGWRPLIFFLVAAALSLLLYLSWRRSLRSIFNL